MRFRLFPSLALVIACSISCSSSSSSNPSASTPGNDAAVEQDGAPEDAALDQGLDATSGEDAVDGDGSSIPDATQDQAVEDALPPGAQLVIENVFVSGAWMGEAVMVVGPDGTSVLIDTASGLHAAALFEAIERNVGKRSVDWVVITHYHEDHIGGFDKLFRASTVNGDNPAVIQRGVVTRGMVDIGADNVGANGFGQLCSWLGDAAHASLRHDLCSGPAQAPCDGSTTGAPWAASSCDGLRMGVLDDPGDDGAGALSTIQLGGGASIVFFAANAHVASGAGVESAEQSGVVVGEGANGPENGRSVGAILRWGNFSYVFAGDMTGEGESDNPDIESFVVGKAPGILVQPGGAPLFETGMSDVVHVSHHGYNTSTNQAWVDWLLPNDGQARNAVIGANHNYLLAPAAKVLGRLGPRVGAGSIWVTEPGTGGSSHPRLVAAKGAVVIRVKDDGNAYSVAPRTGGVEGPAQEFVSTSP
ncbi:MAG: MBL fold metallo-hydrolase [Deltaproteobacteria bacterium]|nr:MBL fold metallo-hydrolase [Deltaproteobacteria bacterium]